VQVSNLLFHLEAGEQASIAAHVQVVAQGAGAALAPVGERARRRGFDDLARIEGDAIEGGFEVGTRTEDPLALLASAVEHDAEGDGRARGQQLAQLVQVLGGLVDGAWQEHEVDDGLCAVHGDLVQAFDGVIEALGLRGAIAGRTGGAGEAHADLGAGLDESGGACGKGGIAQGRAVGEESEPEAARDHVFGHVHGPGEQQRLASEDGHAHRGTETRLDLVDHRHPALAIELAGARLTGVGAAVGAAEIAGIGELQLD